LATSNDIDGLAVEAENRETLPITERYFVVERQMKSKHTTF